MERDLISGGAVEARILVVDDDAATLRLVEQILRRDGYGRITTTRDSRAAVDLFRSQSPDVVVLDLHMPEMGGFQVMERLRSLVPAGSYLPILMVTADGSSEAKERALSSGAADFIVKPFDRVEFLLRVRNLLQTRGLHHALARQNELLEATVEDRTRALGSALARAEEANQAKSKFLSVISHELRTPLTSILSHAEMLTTGAWGPLEPSQRESVTRITTAAWHLAALIHEILEFADGRQREQGAEREPIEGNAIAAEVLDIVSSLADAQGVALRHVPADGPSEIESDPVRLRRVLLHLLENAIKYSEDGEVVLRVTESPEGMEFEVSDEGVGIAEEDLERIWEPFWQAEDPLTRSRGGAGLGLSVVRSQVSALGAQIQVESRLGQGSAFRIFLPRSVSAA